MRKLPVLLLLLGHFFIVPAQVKITIPINVLEKDISKLVELNDHTPGLVDMSGREAVRLMDSATALQIIKITAPYMSSSVTNAKTVCENLLARALLMKTESQLQKETIVEILCKNYLNENEFYKVHTILLTLTQKDFNEKAKQYVTSIINNPGVCNDRAAYTVLGLAQIKKSIPFLWKQVGEGGNNIGMQTKLDIWASLARMGEKKAALLLCNYYDSVRKEKGYWSIFAAKQMAFAMDRHVLGCLVSDYKKIDIKYSYRDGDTGFHPAQVLGGAITVMLKEYPYKKGEYNIDPQQLLDWLNQRKQYLLAEK